MHIQKKTKDRKKEIILTNNNDDDDDNNDSYIDARWMDGCIDK